MSLFAGRAVSTIARPGESIPGHRPSQDKRHAAPRSAACMADLEAYGRRQALNAMPVLEGSTVQAAEPPND